jgi:hypothetical protein
VSRERPANDQRSLQVQLTEAGREIYERVMPVAAYYEEVLASKMPRKEAAALKVTLVSLYDNLDRIEAEIDSGEIDRLIKPRERQMTGRLPGRSRVKGIPRRAAMNGIVGGDLSDN